MTEKPQLTDAEFDALKQRRDAELEAVIAATCAEMGWERDGVMFHVSGMHGCYCACPTGPCQHRWDGPDVELTGEHENQDGTIETFSGGFSKTCSKCGTDAMSHDVRTSDF